MILDLTWVSFVDFVLRSWYSICTWFMYDDWLCGVGIGPECSYSLDYFTFLSSMCYLEVVLAIRDSFPRNVLV